LVSARNLIVRRTHNNGKQQKSKQFAFLKRSFLILQLIIDLVKDLHFLEAAVTVDIHFEHAGLGTDKQRKKKCRRNRLGEDIQAKAKRNQPTTPAARGRNTLHACSPCVTAAPALRGHAVLAPHDRHMLAAAAPRQPTYVLRAPVPTPRHHLRHCLH